MTGSMADGRRTANARATAINHDDTEARPRQPSSSSPPPLARTTERQKARKPERERKKKESARVGCSLPAQDRTDGDMYVCLYTCTHACMEKRTATQNFGRVELGRATHRQIDLGPLTYTHTHTHTPHRRTASPPAANLALTCFALSVSARSICTRRPHPPAPTATNSSGSGSAKARQGRQGRRDPRAEHAQDDGGPSGIARRGAGHHYLDRASSPTLCLVLFLLGARSICARRTRLPACLPARPPP